MVNPMINPSLVTPLFGRMSYTRLHAVRALYQAEYGRGLRDDLKSKIFPTASFGKLMRHFTMSRAEWALKTFKTARAKDRKGGDKATKASRLEAELGAIEALCVLDRRAMKELQEAFEREKDCKALVEELGTRWLNHTPGGEKVRALIVGMVKNRLGIGGMPSTAPKEAKLQGEALSELLNKDDPLGLEALCRQLCGNRTREHLELVRSGFEEARSGNAWLDQNLQPRVLKNVRSEPLLHAALSLCFDDPPYYFVNYLYNTCSGTNPSASASGGGGSKAPMLQTTASLKTTWALEGKRCTEALVNLVTICKDRQLAAVGQLLQRSPFHMSLGTLVLSVTDSETRKLLSLIVDAACHMADRGAIDPALVSASPETQRRGFD